MSTGVTNPGVVKSRPENVTKGLTRGKEVWTRVVKGSKRDNDYVPRKITQRRRFL